MGNEKIVLASDQGSEDEVRQAVAYATPKSLTLITNVYLITTTRSLCGKLNRHKQAEALCKKVADEYFEILGLTPKGGHGQEPRCPLAVINRPPDVHEHIKHLADVLEVYAQAREGQLPAPFNESMP